MSTDPPPLDDLDLSAVLDDEADAGVRERLAADPAARDRLAALRAAREAVGRATVEPLPDDVVDELVATALADGAVRADPVVAPLPSRQTRQVPPWLVAAVVVVLVGLGLGLVWSGRDDATEVTFQTVGQSITAESDDGTGSGASRSELDADAITDGDVTASGDAAESAAAPTTTVPGVAVADLVLIDLGPFPDDDALRIALRDAFPTESIERDAPPSADDLTAAARCLGKVDGLFGTFDDPTSVGIAEVDGTQVAVYELPFRTDDGRDTSLVLAVDQQTCIPVLSFQR